MAKVSDTYKEITTLNNKVRNKEIFSEEFYFQLKVLNCEVNKSVILEIIPEGGNTYYGTIIRQDGKIFQFDLDLDEAEHSILNDISADFNLNFNKLRRTKPWSKEVVGLQIFNEIKQE